MKAIADNGYQPVRINTDQFNEQIAINFSNLGSKFVYEISGLYDSPVDLVRAKAIWNRKIWPVQVPEQLDANYQEVFRQEYHTFRSILLESWAALPWMNPEDLDRKVAGNKLSQLDLARQCSLRVPASMFSNDAKRIESFFYDCCQEKMIAKLHGVLSVSMQGGGQNFPTTQITRKELKFLPDQLPYCPMIFQELIPKAFELRIAYVDGFCFAGKVNTGGEALDWRGQQATEFSWQAFELPGVIQQKIQLMMQTSGLLFGVLDMIVTPEGEYVFLETNPKGEWGMLQKYLDYPIAETIVKQLISKISY